MTARLQTLAEAAAELRKSGRWLRDWLCTHRPPTGQPAYYLQAGRDRLFSPSDLARIEARIREETPCRSGLSHHAKAKARTGRSVAPTSELQWTEAQALLGRPLRPGSSATSRQRIERGEYPERPARSNWSDLLERRDRLHEVKAASARPCRA